MRTASSAARGPTEHSARLLRSAIPRGWGGGTVGKRQCKQYCIIPQKIFQFKSVKTLDILEVQDRGR